ncbi:MAG: class A beta-lactamase, subclass A2 [Bacteroidetes bacterium]|nr:class A beta-lactamase, subclass A2 [Bacteroidota bacterium]
MKIITTIFILLAVLIGSSLSAQQDSLNASVEKIIGDAKCSVGICIKHVESGERFLFHNSSKYPMQSVFKFPLAMAVLSLVDRRQLSLDSVIHVTKDDLLPDTWSPMREKYPSGADVKLSEILSFTVSTSDNNGCDLLFKLAGGPSEVNKYIHNLGVTDINIQNNEREMHADYTLQFLNWARPSAMAELLEILMKGTALSKTSNDFLLKVMIETQTGPKRIKGLFPDGTVVAHKTGSSGADDKGVTAACNDAGIVTLPDGTHLIIAAFVSMSENSEDYNDSVIAKISKLAWDYFTKTGK